MIPNFKIKSVFWNPRSFQATQLRTVLLIVLLAIRLRLFVLPGCKLSSFHVKETDPCTFVPDDNFNCVCQCHLHLVPSNEIYVRLAVPRLPTQRVDTFFSCFCRYFYKPSQLLWVQSLSCLQQALLFVHCSVVIYTPVFSKKTFLNSLNICPSSLHLRRFWREVFSYRFAHPWVLFEILQRLLITFLFQIPQ